MSITLAEETERGRDSRQVMVSAASCHPALILPDGHPRVTELRHNSAGFSSDTNCFLPTLFFPAVPVEKGSYDHLFVHR